MAMTLTRFILYPPEPSAKDLLVLHLWIVGSFLLAGILGALLAYGITRPVRRAILEAQKNIGNVEPDPPPIKAANEVGTLSALFNDQLAAQLYGLGLAGIPGGQHENHSF